MSRQLGYQPIMEIIPLANIYVLWFVPPCPDCLEKTLPIFVSSSVQLSLSVIKLEIGHVYLNALWSG